MTFELKSGVAGLWIAGILAGVPVAGPEPERAHGGGSGNVTGRALSVNALRAAIESPGYVKHLEEHISRMAGMTDLVGYTVDAANGDIILLGKVEAGREPVFLEDFVVALRSTFLKYTAEGVRRRNYIAPMCSIDPTPETVRRLGEIQKRFLNRSPDDRIDLIIDEWERACREPQKVNIYGIAPDCRFVDVMIRADYVLKKLADGIDAIDIPGFMSHTDMILQQARNDYLQGKRPDISSSIINRFWFCPGDIRFSERENTLLLRKCAIRLFTELQVVAKDSVYRADNRQDPLALQFTRQFDDLYDRIAQVLPVYRDLDALFRFMCLAEALRLKDAFETAGLNPEFLLKTFKVPRVAVPATIPGCPRFAETKSRREVEGGYKTAHFRVPSCGGIKIDIKISPETFERDTSGMVHDIERAAIETRPSPDTLSWDFEIDWLEEQENGM